MNKALFLRFENAGYFTNQKFTKDRVFEVGNNIPRKEHFHYVEPITVNQISNVLHVLMGERPAPSLRKSVIKRNENIFNLADAGYLKINTISSLNKVKNVNEFPSEVMTIRKSIHNAYNPIEIITWNRVRQLLSNEIFFDFMALLNNILNENVYENYTAKKAMILIREKLINMDKYNKSKDPKKGENSVNFTVLNECIENEDFKNFINNNFNGNSRNFQKTPMIKYILDYKYCGFNSNNNTIDLVSFGVDNVCRIDGEIIIPLDDYHYEKLRNGNGFATILDGGAVWIDKIVDSADVGESDINGFRKVSEISTEITQNN